MSSSGETPVDAKIVPVLALTSDHDLLVSLNTRMSIAIDDFKRWQEVTTAAQTRFDERQQVLQSRMDKAEGGVKGIIAVATILGGVLGGLLGVAAHPFLSVGLH